MGVTRSCQRMVPQGPAPGQFQAFVGPSLWKRKGTIAFCALCIIPINVASRRRRRALAVRLVDAAMTSGCREHRHVSSVSDTIVASRGERRARSAVGATQLRFLLARTPSTSFRKRFSGRHGSVSNGGLASSRFRLTIGHLDSCGGQQ